MRLRDKIKSVEFSAEQLQQQVLESLVSVEGPSSGESIEHLGHVVDNLTTYAEYSGFEICDAVRRKFALIICAALPGLDESDVARALDL